jgi:hypothetical protein
LETQVWRTVNGKFLWTRGQGSFDSKSGEWVSDDKNMFEGQTGGPGFFSSDDDASDFADDTFNDADDDADSEDYLSIPDNLEATPLADSTPTYPGQTTRDLVTPHDSQGKEIESKYRTYAVKMNNGKELHLTYSPSVPKGDLASEAQIQKVLSTVADNAERYPALDGSLRAPNLIVETQDEIGDCVAKTSSDSLHEIQINAKDLKNNFKRAGDKGYLYPSSKVDRPAYIMTHEFGHTMIESGRTGGNALAYFRQAKKTEKLLSEYALENEHEAAAEAFAEWNMTNGQTTNAVVQAYCANTERTETQLAGGRLFTWLR